MDSSSSGKIRDFEVSYDFIAEFILLLDFSVHDFMISVVNLEHGI